MTSNPLSKARASRRAYLLTGGPGTGKTTLIKEALSLFSGKAGGFYTEEVRERGVRQGFRIITLKGESAPLAKANFPSPYRVSKYGVDIASLEKVGVPAIIEAIHSCEVVVIDEIGRMELFSPAFREAVLEALGSGKKVLGTIMLAPHPFADALKARPEVRVLTLSRANWHEVLEEVLKWLKEGSIDGGESF